MIIFLDSLNLSIREIGYGDQSINKKMKDYLNLFYSMIDKIHNWEELLSKESKKIYIRYIYWIIASDRLAFLVDYFDKYRLNLLNNTLNSI